MPSRHCFADVFLSHRRQSRAKSDWNGHVTRRQSTMNGPEIAEFELALEASVISYDCVHNNLI